MVSGMSKQNKNVLLVVRIEIEAVRKQAVGACGACGRLTKKGMRWASRVAAAL